MKIKEEESYFFILILPACLFANEGLYVYSFSTKVTQDLLLDSLAIDSTRYITVLPSGDYAYIVSPGTNLNVLDISNPASLAVLAIYYKINAVSATLSNDGNYLYTPSGNRKLLIFDLSIDPIILYFKGVLNPGATLFTKYNLIQTTYSQLQQTAAFPF